MSKKSGLILCLFALFACNVFATSYMESISTRSTKVEGFLKCGKEPLPNAHVRLFRTSSEDLSDVIASGVSDSQGRFSLEGDTSRFQGEASAIDPYLRIYHKCDEPESKSGFRHVVLRYPREFVTLGRVPRRTYNVGALNLELGFPKESRQKTLEGITN